MADSKQTVDISDEERAADGRADATAMVALVVIAVATVVFWLSGQ